MTPTLAGPSLSPHCHDTTAEFPDQPTVPTQVSVGVSRPQPEVQDSGTDFNPPPAVSEPEPVMQTPEPVIQTPESVIQTPEPVIQTPEPVKTNPQVPVRRSIRSNAGKPPSKYSPSIFDLS